MTAERAAMSSALEAERLDAIGGVAAGVAHHLSNIMMVALGNVQLAILQGTDERTIARLRKVERAVYDATEVVRSLASVSCTQPMRVTAPIDINRLVDDVIELTARDGAVDVHVEHGDLAPVAGDAAALRQALLNIVRNAVEAMPQGGTLSVRTWQDEGGVHCTISDTGIGMSADVRRRALEPFHTTKGPKSRGLGLAVAHGIVVRYGGRLEIDSVEGLGTSVAVLLPPAH